MHDLIVVGGGPAGLSAALNGASEGLDTLLLERSERFGGQAATTSRIENYLGFPEGLSGPALLGRAERQARRLGARLLANHEVRGLHHASDGWNVRANGETFKARAVVLALGETFRRLHVPGDRDVRFYFGARPTVHPHYAGKRVAVVGGGNSAAQATLNLSRFCAHVDVVTRSPLEATVSDYLAERIRQAPSVSIHRGNVVDVKGHALELDSGDVLPDVAAVFGYIGAEPHTSFLKGELAVDDRGFIASEGFSAGAGAFVIGDVRSGSRKRVAAAVGEGSAVIADVFRFVRGEAR